MTDAHIVNLKSEEGLALLRNARNGIIEECARVAEREEFWDYLKPQAHIAAAIRALKDKKP